MTKTTEENLSQSKYAEHRKVTSGRNSGKQLVFGKARGNPKKLKALHGPSLPRGFHRQDMESLFNKKIKTRFPILFKRALDFYLMKAKGEFKVVI